MSDTKEAAKRKDSFVLTLSMIEIDPEYNVREMETKESKEHLAWMVASIRRNGIRTPLRGYKKRGTDKYVITAGHTRIAAVVILEKEGQKVEIPFMPEERETDEIKRIFDLVTTNSGKPLSLLEKAKVAERLFEKGLKKKEIAEGFGESQSNIDHLKTLMTATEETKQWIREGKVSASSVIDAVREVGPEAAEQEIGKLIAKNEGKGKVSKRDVKEREEKEQEEGKKNLPVKKLQKFRDEIVARAEDKKNKIDDNKIFILENVLDWAKGVITDTELEAIFKK